MTCVSRICRLSLLFLAFLAQLAGTIGVPLPTHSLAEVLEVESETIAFHPCGCPINADAKCCCCSSGGCCKTESASTATQDITIVGGVWTARCQGEGANWWFSLPSFPVVANLLLFAPAPLTELRPSDEFALRITLPFPDPPPRV